jgi:hypothetical protein
MIPSMTHPTKFSWISSTCSRSNRCGSPPLLGQIVEARNARLARITLANAGVSTAQWLAMLMSALGALTVIALCHNRHFGTQVVAMTLYTFVATAAFFVLLAHDRPFVGTISVSPAPIVQLTTAK